MRTLRGQVLVGALLWTVGLAAVVGLGASVIHGGVSLTWLLHDGLLFVTAVACMIAGLMVVTGAFAPLNSLRSRLAQVRAGADRQVGGQYPSEIQPLVDDLNAMLAHNDRVIARATAKAGDLAHGLKTPLAILANEADRVASAGDPFLAAVLRQQVTLMHRQVEYHLAHARAAASGTAINVRCSVVPAVDGLVRTLARLHDQRGVSIENGVDPAHEFAGRREDLDEMLGNLLDNACKWARTRVRVGSAAAADRITIAVDDDGPGLDRGRREEVLRRGVRADEAVPGSGLGLAIVRDLADVYGGRIALEDSRLGGLRVVLTLPAARRGA